MTNTYMIVAIGLIAMSVIFFFIIVLKEEEKPRQRDVIPEEPKTKSEKEEEEAIRKGLRENIICADCAKKRGCATLRKCEDEVVAAIMRDESPLGDGEFYEFILDRCSSFKRK